MKKVIYSEFSDIAEGSTSPVLNQQEIDDLTAAIAQIAADDILSSSEKVRTFVPTINELTALATNFISRADSLSIDRTALTTARDNFINYLNSLTPAWDDTTQNTPIDRVNLNALLKDFTDELAALQSNISGQQGPAGVNGLNNATVFIFQRAASAPDLPTSNATYTFSTNTVTGLDNGWSATIPSTNGDPLFVSVATASSRNSTDVIAPAEWSGAQILVQDGTPGSSGADGINVASVFIYNRSGVQPFLPSNNVTYNFTTGEISGLNNGWSSTIPANNANPLYISTATASNIGGTDTILATEWAIPQILANNGNPGANLVIQPTAEHGLDAWSTVVGSSTDVPPLAPSGTESIEVQDYSLQTKGYPGPILGRRFYVSAWVKTVGFTGLTTLIPRTESGVQITNNVISGVQSLWGGLDWTFVSVVIEITEEADNFTPAIMMSAPGTTLVWNYRWVEIPKNAYGEFLEDNADVTKTITGKSDIILEYNSEGALATPLPTTSLYKLVPSGGGTGYTSGVTWSVSVESGAFTGAVPTVSGTGFGSLSLNSGLSTPEALLAVKADYNNKSYYYTVKINKQTAPPNTSSSNGDAGSSNWASFGLPWTPVVTLPEVEAASGTATLRATNVKLTAFYSTSDTRFTNVAFKWQISSDGGSTWSDATGVAFDSNPDPGQIDEGGGLVLKEEGSVSCSDSCSVTPNNFYKFRIIARATTGLTDFQAVQPGSATATVST